MKWICCQLGAREHYAIPRALYRAGMLERLLTDTWLNPANPLSVLKALHRGRFHPRLADAAIRAWNIDFLLFESAARLRQRGWPLIMARNAWFQKKVAAALTKVRWTALDSRPVLFSYSYAALAPFRLAKKRGWHTVLGQIDPGPGEEQIVGHLQEEAGEVRSDWQPAPAKYWQGWREECELADQIIVNSEWSRHLLEREITVADKITVIPLAYEQPPSASSFRREYPARFSVERPLRVLFLGTFGLRKGAREILEAAKALESSPVEFLIVGPVQVGHSDEEKHFPRVCRVGPVARSGVAEWYRKADVFLFPTHSDGFGLTQLEAQAWTLPVIASRNCGEVVRDGENGLLLAEVSATEIESAISRILKAPSLLSEWSRNSRVEERFSLAALGHNLQQPGRS